MCLAACGRGTQSQVTATPSAASTPSAVTGKPSGGILPSGVAQRTGAPAAAPRPAQPAYHDAQPVPAGQPQILAASVSPSVVGSGTVVSAVVHTTPGVVSVVASAAGVSLAIPRVGPGLFAGSATIPELPPFARGSYSVTFVARDARGARTQSAVGVVVR